MNKHDFSFLGDYDKDELVRYLASLFLFEQNSTHIIRATTLLYNALVTEGGDDAFCAEDFEKKVGQYYPYDMMEDPQEFMYVDTVHSQKGTFRVFPGIFTSVHYNLTRLFLVAMSKKIDDDTFGEVYALLDLSDQIAQRCGFARYEKGDNNYGEFSLPGEERSTEKQSYLIFTQKELEQTFAKYGQSWEEAEQNIYYDNASAIEQYFETRDCYSPIETTPFYLLNSGDFLVMEPSALLTSAYLRCLTVMRAIHHEEDLEEDYLEIVKTVCHKAVKYADRICACAERYGRVSCLVYQFDADKVARVCFSFYQDYEEGIRRCDEMVKEKWPGMDVMKIHIISSLDFEKPHAFPYDEMTLTVDDFTTIMGNEQGMLNDLYDYYKSRDRFRGKIGMSGEVDMYGFYCQNKRTLYQDKEYHMVNLMPDLFFGIKCNYLQKSDRHLIDYGGQKVMVKHLDELPLELPIYEPDSYDQIPMLIGEYRNATVAACFSPDNEDEHHVLREMTKALLVRFFMFEHRHGESLFKPGNYRLEVCFVDGMTVLFNIKSHDLLLTVSRRFFEKDYQGKTDEQALLDFVLEKMNHYGYILASDFQKKSQQIFDECKGQMLLVERNGLEYWQIHDQYDGTYDVNEHLCDEVLDEIAEHLSRKGEDVMLTWDGSWNTATKVVDFLGDKLNALLERYASKEFVMQLLKLHHGSLYWLATTQVRSEKVNALMRYVGASFDEQKDLLFKYSETNNLTQCLIERIVSKDFNSATTIKDFPLREIDHIYAYMHELYVFGSYMDILSTKMPGYELRIIPNGRVELPQNKINERMSYFLNLRENELYRPEAYRKLSAMRSILNIDVEDAEFQEAFKEEFKVDFSKWKAVIGQSLDYAFDAGQPIVDLIWKEFEDKVLLKVLESDEVDVFRSAFCLFKGMADGASYSESFIQRFNRKFQISSRPWILYQGRVLFSTKSLHQHERIMLERLNEGKLHPVSSKMKSYLRENNRKKGAIFENDLTGFYNALGLGHLLAFHGVKIGPGEQLENEEMIGDIDVLLINTERKKIVCMETKNYYESRTFYEILSENRKTEDDLEMPIKRDTWGKGHMLAFRAICKEVDESYTCSSVFVTVNMPAYKYFHSEEDRPIKVLSALDLMDNPMIVFDV